MPYYYYYYYLLIRVFTSALADGLSLEFEWQQVSSSFQDSSLLLLAVFNNAVVWMVSTRSPTSKSSRPFDNPLVAVPKAPITIGIIVIFMFHSFLNSLARSRYLSLFSHSVLFCGQPGQQSRQFYKFSFFFFLIIIRSGLLAEIRWSVCMCYAAMCSAGLQRTVRSRQVHLLKQATDVGCGLPNAI